MEDGALMSVHHKKKKKKKKGRKGKEKALDCLTYYLLLSLN